MSKSIIEDLYYGKRGNAEEIKVGKEYWSIMNKICETEKDMFDKFSDEQKAIHNEIAILQGGLQSEVGLASFKEGLKIGIRLGIECFIEEKEEH